MVFVPDRLPYESFNPCMYKVHAMDSDCEEYKNHPHGYWLPIVFIAQQGDFKLIHHKLFFTP